MFDWCSRASKSLGFYVLAIPVWCCVCGVMELEGHVYSIGAVWLSGVLHPSNTCVVVVCLWCDGT